MDEQSKRFLLQQLEWLEQQDMKLAKIENKLKAMRDLAQYRLQFDLTVEELSLLNGQLQQLQNEVEALQSQLYEHFIYN